MAVSQAITRITRAGGDGSPDPALSLAFKAAMRRLTATVCIITSRQDGCRIGMAATAVSSLTTTPPSMLICVNQAASIHQTLGVNGRFCVNLLGCTHSDLVSVFSGKLTGEERFGVGIWGENASGIPYLEDAQASLFCTVAKSMAHGTHTIFVGEVDEVRVGGETAPLLYQEGAFHRAIGLEVTS